MPASHSVVADPEDHRAVVEEAREYAVGPAVATAVRRDSAVHRCDPPPIGRNKGTNARNARGLLRFWRIPETTKPPR